MFLFGEGVGTVWSKLYSPKNTKPTKRSFFSAALIRVHIIQHYCKWHSYYAIAVILGYIYKYIIDWVIAIVGFCAKPMRVFCILYLFNAIRRCSILFQTTYIHHTA